MSFYHFILTSVAIFSLICTIAVVFFERKNPSSSLAWVLVLVFLPVIGFILYLFLGSGYKANKRRKYMLKRIADNLYDTFIIKHLNIERSAEFIHRHGNCARLLTYLENAGDGVFTDNNSADVFIDGKEMFERLFDDLRKAEKHIHVLFYIIRNDRLGRELVDILTEKAKQGLEVKLIYDCIGTMMAFDTMFHGLKKAGGMVMPFSPLFSSLNSHLRLNYRNHRKIVVIDGVIGYVGGMNVGEEYANGDKKLRPWRDTHLRITGSAVWFLQERFMMDWAYSAAADPKQSDLSSYFPDPIGKGNLGMHIISSGPDTLESPIKSGLLEMIYAAKKNIYLQTPYFAPDQSFYDALRIAAHSKVDVRLMIPKISDYQIVQRTTLGYVRDVLSCGVKVYMYNGFIHAKTMVIDGIATTIGTTNITNRSFTLDFEVNAFIYDKDFSERYENIFHQDLLVSERVGPEFFHKQSYLTRASYNFARLLAPLM